ncbi:MAG: cytochrome bd oxidase small subunit CydS [Tuberibacillus sp.]
MQTFLITYLPIIVVISSIAAAFWAGLKDEGTRGES